jgi:hypothetical protein
MKKTVIKIAPLYLLLTMMCINEYNPFQDPYKAGAMMIVKPFSGSPVVNIFTTDTCVIGVSLPEFVDSFQVEAAHNRYWSDTTIRKPKADTFNFLVSFTDIGLQRIRVTSFISNNTKFQNDTAFEVSSPLHQPDLSVTLNDSTISLTTTPVKDDVWYLWKIGSIPKKTQIPKAEFNIRVKGTYACSLWVSPDSIGTIKSSASTFTITLEDTIPPNIELDTNSIRGDTIVTGDAVYTLYAQITDASGIKSAYIGENEIKPSGPGYRTTLRIGESDTIKKYTIEATDNSGLKATKTFYLHYIPNLPSNRPTELEILKVSDTIWTNKSSYTITGTIFEKDLPRVNITATVQDKPLFYDTTVVLGNDLSADWHLTVALQEKINTITVIARDSTNDTLTTAKLNIFRSSLVKDTVKPFMYVRINDIRGQENTKRYIPKTSAELFLVANDASGIKEVTVNDSAMVPFEQGASWIKTIAPISHTNESQINITARDSAGNETTQLFILQKNLTPTVPDGFQLPAFLTVGQRIELPLRIIDDDQVTVRITSGPQEMKAVDRGGNQWYIVWSPTPADTGNKSAIINVEDNIDSLNLPTWNFTVFNSTPTVRFQDTIIRFPRWVEIDSPITTPLQVKANTGRPTFHYKVWSINRRKMLMDSSKTTYAPYSFRWVFHAADTGVWNLAVGVFDTLGGSDTIYPNAFEVLPHNSDPCSLFVKFSAGADTRGDTLDMRNRFVADTVIIAINDSDRPETDHRSIVVNAPGRFSFGTDSSTISIVILPEVNRPNDTIRVCIADKEGARDTVTIPVLFPTWTVPDKMAGLSLWLDAASGIGYSEVLAVDSWTDKSANKIKLSYQGIAPKYSNAAVNGKPAVLFNGVSNRLAGTVPNWIANPFTIFLVMSLDTVDPTKYYTIVSPSLVPNFGLGIVSDRQLGMFLQEGSTNKNTPSGQDISQKKWYIFSFSSSGITGSTFTLTACRNGREGLLPMTITEGITPSSSFVLGSAKSSSSIFPCNGAIAEVVMFADKLSESHLAQIENYLANKYEITLEK